MWNPIVLTQEGELSVTESDPDAVVVEVNRQLVTDNPNTPVIVARTSDGRGYGLFAIRDIRKGERVATYGGRQYSGPDAWDQVNAAHAHLPADSPMRDYVVKVTDTLVLDTGLFFRPGDAGRYVNESFLGQNWMANVEGKYHKASGQYWFQAKKDIDNGDEIIAYYGPDYGVSKYGPKGPPWRWYNREPTKQLVNAMTVAVIDAKGRLAKRKQGGVSTMDAEADVRAAIAQRDTVEKKVAGGVGIQCQLCGRLAQHRERGGGGFSFCNEECQLEFYHKNE